MSDSEEEHSPNNSSNSSQKLRVSGTGKSPEYGEKKYWEDRYKDQKESTFDWLEDYETLKPIFKELNLDKTNKIINLGCGNAEFSENMYDDGYQNIVNIDISENVITTMKERSKERLNMTYEVMDVRKLQFNENEFDVAIDKSTMDAVLCGDNSFFNVAVMTKEVQRILKTGGYYVVISYGQPNNRVFHLEREHLSFDINIFTIKKDFQIEMENGPSKHEKIHYVYVCKKKEDASKVCLEHFDRVSEELRKQEEIDVDCDYNNPEDDEQIKDDLILNNEEGSYDESNNKDDLDVSD